MKAKLANLKTKVLATLAERTIAASNKVIYLVVKDNVLLTEVETAYEGYDAVYAKQTYSGKGVLVAEADERCDAPFEGIKSILSGFIKINGYSKQQEAKDLYHVIEVHGLDLDRYNYSEQTAAKKKLIEEFDLPENVIKIVSLSLTEVFGMQKTSHFDFIRVYDEQVAANSILRQTESATSIRKNVELTLRNYLNLVTAMKQMPGWKELYIELNELVKAARNSNLTSPDETPETAVTPAV